MSISPTFYARLFLYESFARSFFCAYILDLRFFLAQEYWCNSTHKLLVKLTTCRTILTFPTSEKNALNEEKERKLLFSAQKKLSRMIPKTFVVDVTVSGPGFLSADHVKCNLIWTD